MTYEEKIKDAIGCIKRHRRGLSDYNGDWSFFDTAIEALEKQMPKKPKEEWSESPFSDDKGCLFRHLMCPNCGKMEVNKLDDFCPHCGQALNWEDVECR